MNKELLQMVFNAMSYGNAQDRESARLAVGAALAEQPAQQEPVSWCSQCGHKCPPAQRTWVGLTAKDWNVIGFTAEFRAGAEWANDKLKEKNT